MMWSRAPFSTAIISLALQDKSLPFGSVRVFARYNAGAYLMQMRRHNIFQVPSF
jgi:hypothetical protein